jgi:hypothetical protein
MTDAEYAAFGLSRMSFLASYDAEYAPRVASFMRLHGGSLSMRRQTDPAEMDAAMRLTIHGGDEEKAAARQRYRSLMDSVFERSGFNPVAAGE